MYNCAISGVNFVCNFLFNTSRQTRKEGCLANSSKTFGTHSSKLSVEELTSQCTEEQDNAAINRSNANEEYICAVIKNSICNKKRNIFPFTVYEFLNQR